MKRIIVAVSLLAVLGCVSSVGSPPRRSALVQLAREGGRYQVLDLSYDEAQKQAMVSVQDITDKTTTNAVYRWYSFEGDRWRSMPMVGVQRPANLAAPTMKPSGTNVAPLIHFEPAAR
jgi:hypothetical protein